MDFHSAKKYWGKPDLPLWHGRFPLLRPWNRRSAPFRCFAALGDLGAARQTHLGHVQTPSHGTDAITETFQTTKRKYEAFKQKLCGTVRIIRLKTLLLAFFCDYAWHGRFCSVVIHWALRASKSNRRSAPFCCFAALGD